MNHYFAMLNEQGTPTVTLPAPRHGTRIASDGVVSGLTGAMSVWNGPPREWCYAIIEVKSPEPWYLVPDAHKTTVWKRS